MKKKGGLKQKTHLSVWSAYQNFRKENNWNGDETLSQMRSKDEQTSSEVWRVGGSKSFDYFLLQKETLGNPVDKMSRLEISARMQDKSRTGEQYLLRLERCANWHFPRWVSGVSPLDPWQIAQICLTDWLQSWLGLPDKWLTTDSYLGPLRGATFLRIRNPTLLKRAKNWVSSFGSLRDEHLCRVKYSLT